MLDTLTMGILSSVIGGILVILLAFIFKYLQKRYWAARIHIPQGMYYVLLIVVALIASLFSYEYLAGYRDNTPKATIIITGAHYDCRLDILTIVAILPVQNLQEDRISIYLWSEKTSMSTKDIIQGISTMNIWDESKKTSTPNKYSIVANVRLGSVKEYISIEYRYDNEQLISDPVRLQRSFCSNSDFVKSFDYSASPNSSELEDCSLEIESTERRKSCINQSIFWLSLSTQK